jgi:glycosyltransferase involved in cell wall biosynthesis
VLDNITPVILTRNEAPNIERTLRHLTWARDIVVVDSFSEDDTARSVTQFPQARLFFREFDGHATQWEFALRQTGISTDWVLALDADYVVPQALVSEIAALTPALTTMGYQAHFQYLVHGHPLRGSAYPPVTVLYRRAGARYVQDGHTQRVVLDGEVKELVTRVLHDDRKPLERWIEAQRRYMKLEAEKLAGRPWRELGWKDRLRTLKFVAPVGMGIYCFVVKGAVLDGRAGLFYTLQRVVSETLLSLYLIEAEQRRAPKPVTERAEVSDTYEHSRS